MKRKWKYNKLSLFKYYLNTLTIQKFDFKYKFSNEYYSSNFRNFFSFEINNIFINTIHLLSNEIYNLKKGKIYDEYSLKLRYYLENSENGNKLITFKKIIINYLFIWILKNSRNKNLYWNQSKKNQKRNWK